jgi:hypothetical protein
MNILVTVLEILNMDRQTDGEADIVKVIDAFMQLLVSKEIERRVGLCTSNVFLYSCIFRWSVLRTQTNC